MPAMDTTSHPGHEIRRGHPLAIDSSPVSPSKKKGVVLLLCAIHILTNGVRVFFCLIDLYSLESTSIDSTQRQMAIHIKEAGLPWWVKVRS
ncbi:hypothetical protein BHM03_00049419 [Ensete ventricosum]|nr:hypothetical protein BHM03_00049419 [Ensete ventricosum]